MGVIIPDAVTAAQRAKFERTLDSFTAMRQQVGTINCSVPTVVWCDLSPKP